jgi:ubiquinone/menaquinone biosynthesis C-methylase UbiE
MSSSIADANRDFFDKISNAYDSKPFFAKMNQQLGEWLSARVDWVGLDPHPIHTKGNEGKEVRLLDYACGTGLLSRVSTSILSLHTHLIECDGVWVRCLDMDR